MSLRGIDIASHQAGIDLSKVDADFVIVKATGGTLYDNPEFRRQAEGALAAGKLLGIYHYAREDYCPGDAATEAAHFLNAFKPYKGRAIPVLDWEGSAVSLPIEWPAQWMRAIERETGATPWFYSYSSYVNSHDCSKLAGWPLWIAAYYAGYEPMGYQTNPPLHGGTGAWKAATAYQYTSTGNLAGYNGRLDLNIFYGTRSDWQSMCGGSAAPERELVSCADIAATIHADMCNDERNGYSWRPRWGGDHPDGVKRLRIHGREYSYPLGSWDCSSSVIWSWRQALKGTPYEGSLDGVSTTHGMRDVFGRSGLFEVWDTQSTTAQRGDVYLNDASHTAMCQGPEPDMLSEFSMSENGDVYNNQVGDQTGKESSVHGYYGPWACTLHYNGKADFYTEGDDMPFTFLFQPDDRKEIWFYDGGSVVRLTHVDQMKAIQSQYKTVVGRDIPCYKLGKKNAPWGARFAQAFENRAARNGKLDDEYKMKGWEL